MEITSMSRSVHFSSSVTSLLAMVWLASCGHSSKTMEAYEQSRQQIGQTPAPGPVTPGTPEPTTPAPPGSVPGTPELPPFAFSCTDAANQYFDEANMEPYSISSEVATQVDETMRLMSPAQKATQMMGITVTGNPNYRDIERSPDTEVSSSLTIRGWRYRDAGRGVNLDAGQDNREDDKKNYATAFPSPSLRAASWDLDLERRIGEAIGDETAASKNNMLLAPCMNIIRHPYWGRTQETYGEDMYAIGRMATALTVGLQKYVAACPKHYAANNIEKGRSSQNSVMTEQTLREIYGRHFEMVVQDGGAACMMASYNLVNGEKATQNEHLLRNVLKGPVAAGGMGFEGLVLTDWWAMPGDQKRDKDAATALNIALEAVKAGTDIEVPWQIHYKPDTLAQADQALVDEAAKRVLTQKFRFKSARDTDGWSITPPTSVLAGGSLAPSEAHEALAEETVIKSAVLLSNGTGETTVLPLKAATSIAVVGLDDEFRQVSSSVPPTCGYDPGGGQGEVTATPRECTFKFATDPALGDRGSSRVNADPARSIGIFQGLNETAPEGYTVTSGNSVTAAEAADTVVVVVGYTPEEEGEEYYIAAGGDRLSLDLPPGHNELVQAVLDLDKPTIIVIESGSIVNLPWLSHANQKQATIWAGYPAQRGGLGIGKLIYGQANFAGKMPMAWATEAMLQPFQGADGITTEMGYFFGYREYDRREFVAQEGVAPLVFPFGHGLSYSTFAYSNVTAPCTAVSKRAVFEATVDVENTSDVDGDEVVFLFVKPPAKPSGATGERPWKELKSFTRVAVKKGEKVTAKLPVRIQDLRRWEGGTDGNWVIDSGEYTLAFAKNAADAETTTNIATITVQ
jgi:beta-glucosidase